MPWLLSSALSALDLIKTELTRIQNHRSGILATCPTNPVGQALAFQIESFKLKKCHCQGKAWTYKQSEAAIGAQTTELCSLAPHLVPDDAWSFVVPPSPMKSFGERNSPVKKSGKYSTWYLIFLPLFCRFLIFSSWPCFLA